MFDRIVASLGNLCDVQPPTRNVLGNKGRQFGDGLLRELTDIAKRVDDHVIEGDDDRNKKDTSRAVSVIESRFDYPVFVKPSSAGSSVGVSFADDFEGLKEALYSASKYENSIIVEKKITGRELTVGVIDG
ncbi:MAG: hypothetical protein IKD37_09210, partial [Clostridia bacterium]|nr:hypothetical protein [Clostridia bacterium]